MLAHRPIPARVGIVPDHVLDRLAALAPVLDHRPLTDAEVDLIRASFGAIVEELRNTRRKLETIADLAAPANVVIFAGSR
jgi:hypothetical protein